MVEQQCPKLFGRYEVIGELGRGSMGVVFKARDPVIGRLVAVKAIPETLGLSPDKRDEYISRLRQEAITAGRLQHNNIVTIYDVGENEIGPYIAMEYLDGVTLRDVISASRRLSMGQMMDVVSQVCNGLDYAHGKAVIHRDVKPSNIMIITGNSVKIMDLGIARIPMSELTKEGKLVGSPSYMSPEQLRGKPIDGRSDLFSLGVVIYQCMTLYKPFPGEDINEICYRIVHSEPTPLNKYLDPVNEGLEYFMAKALAKNPDERFQTGTELAEAFADMIELNSIKKIEKTSKTQTMEAAAAMPLPIKNWGPELSSNPNITETTTIDSIFRDLSKSARSFRLEDQNKPKVQNWWWVAMLITGVVLVGMWLLLR